MTIDIIDVTDEELKNFTVVQMQLLRTAQKNKNELLYNLEKDIKLFEKLVLTNDMKESTLAEHKRAELESEYQRKLNIIIEQLNYNLSLSEPYPEGGGSVSEDEAPYIVDYTLSYSERYTIVRNYYLSVEDPSERMALYTADETARKYLGSYYASLYNVLYSYSK